ncbi:MAG: biotin/lipoyl-containing protein, partial [Verrucomicrobiota bacterium]|nr:biotin/lipoyl-containing protein [Verrucomicrobiota bacterium]
MAHEVKIPAAGESINSATIGQWHKADGDTIVKGELLATIETDKVSTELESEAAGTIRIVVSEGEEVPIGTVIAEIAEGAEMSSVDASVAPEPAGEEESEPEEAATGSVEAGDTEVPFGFTTLDDEPEIIVIKVPAAGESIASATIAQWHKRDGEGVREGETLVTLETDKVSAELDAEADGVLNILSPEGMEVSIGAVIGTLTVGAVPATEGVASAPEAQEEELAIPPDTVPPAPVETDFPVAASDPASSAAAALRSTSPLEEETPSRLKPDFNRIPETLTREEFKPFSDGRITRRRLSPLRRKIAAQLVNAQQTAAILTTFNEVDMSAVIELRKTVQESFTEKYGTKLGFMSLFVKAVVHALREVPSLNGRIDGEEIIENHFYDIGIAVGTEK